jgi:hypothetical protein
MAGELAVFVSKRLQRAAAAMLCLTAGQLVLGLAQSSPAPVSVAVRVAIGP